MIRTDFLPRLVDGTVLDNVFTNGRSVFEKDVYPGSMPTMPIEFSVAAYRLGHSMIRGAYQWNRVFKTDGDGGAGIATLERLFRFSGTSGTLSPGGDLNDPESTQATFERLPTNWIADFMRLFHFPEANHPELVPKDGRVNVTKRVDSLLVDPLKDLPVGSFGGRGTTPPSHEWNLAFRNLTRAMMVELATGQQMAQLMSTKSLTPEVKTLTRDEILNGNGGAILEGLTESQKDEIAQNTPLWFYILREAELNGGRLAGVGARIVAEVFHRAMEGSKISIVRDQSWRPSLGPDNQTFRMTELLLFAFEGKAELLNPLGD
jgi:hypothetical protein